MARRSLACNSATVDEPSLPIVGRTLWIYPCGGGRTRAVSRRDLHRLDSSIVGEVNAMRSPPHPYLWACTAMALAALVLLPGTGQAKGGHSHSKKQTRAAVTQSLDPQLPQSTSTSSKPT